MTGSYLQHEPPPGSVVAIDRGGPHQEVWVSNQSNIGNWYTPDIPLRGNAHPVWQDVLRRAEGRTLTLLVTADPGTYAAGYQAAIDAATAALGETLGNLPRPPVNPRREPEEPELG